MHCPYTKNYLDAGCNQLLKNAIGICVALPCLFIAGCASITYVDSNNVQHVVGLLDVSIPESKTRPGGPSATSMTLTTLGVAVYRHPDSNSGVTLGYNRETVVSLPDGACLDITSGDVCKPLAASHNSERAIIQ